MALLLAAVSAQPKSLREVPNNEPNAARENEVRRRASAPPEAINANVVVGGTHPKRGVEPGNSGDDQFQNSH